MSATTLITGNTYPVREQIKALGGRWNKRAQGWDVPLSKSAEAQALVAAAGPDSRGEISDRRVSSRFDRSRYRSHYAYFPSTGGEWYQNKQGRCEDAPCCGCCS